MGETETRAPPRNDLYAVDFYAWTQEQARLLRERRWADLDLNNLIDEVESVGSSEKREIRNRLSKLLSHLLKWRFQPGFRGSSWHRTIRDQRKQIAEILEESPSLRSYPASVLAGAYLSATLEASEETGLAIGIFPNECPFTIDQALDAEFFPEDRSVE
jgi:ribosomal protein L29